MNVAYTAGGRFVEIQGSAEKLGGFDRATMDRMLDVAVTGCLQLMALQRQALERRNLRTVRGNVAQTPASR